MPISTRRDVEGGFAYERVGGFYWVIALVGVEFKDWSYFCLMKIRRSQAFDRLARLPSLREYVRYMVSSLSLKFVSRFEKLY